MKIEKLPSGSYRVRQMYNGKSYSVTFKQKPTKKEVNEALAKRMNLPNVCRKNDTSVTFADCVQKYCDMNNAVLSPTTIGSYLSMLRNMPKWFCNMRFSEILPEDVQRVLNEYSLTHSPKSTKNVNGLISAVFKAFDKTYTYNAKLPKSVKLEPYTPTLSEVKSVLKASIGTEYEVAFHLAALGLRRGEICALDLDSLSGNILTINKAKIQLPGGGTTIKPYPKTEASVRQITIPDYLAEKIRSQGYVYRGSMRYLQKKLGKIQADLGIQHFRLHDLRHFFASFASANNVSESTILATGGWKTDHCMKRVYRHAMQEQLTSDQKALASQIFN